MVKTKKTLPTSMAMAAAVAPKKPKQIVKEGLSEYFIYTIEGTESAALMIRRYDQHKQPHTQRPTAGPKSF